MKLYEVLVTWGHLGDRSGRKIGIFTRHCQMHYTEQINTADMNCDIIQRGTEWRTSEKWKHLNNKLLLVRYSDVQCSNGVLNIGMLFSPVFKWYSNIRQFGNQTTLYHLNTTLVHYSDPHCVSGEICSVFMTIKRFLEKYIIKLVSVELYYMI